MPEGFGPLVSSVAAEPRLQTGGMESLLDVRRLAGLTPSHRHWSFRAVKVVLNVEVMLHFSVERQYLGVRPLIVAERSPGVEIFGQSSLHCLAVDGRPTADHLPLRHVDLTLLLSDCPPEGPIVFRVR